MVPPPALLCSGVSNYPWGFTENFPHLTGTPPQISLLHNMDTTLKSRISIALILLDSLKMELDKRDIRGRYNTKSLMEYV